MRLWISTRLWWNRLVRGPSDWSRRGSCISTSGESDELGEWIEEQYQVASSDEYGQDYEHLEVILASKSHKELHAMGFNRNGYLN